jgi:uncharacterized protein YbjT (DUF2867 family)
MARVIMAGANGKVGKLLAPELRLAGHQVIALVRKGTFEDADTCVTDWTNPSVMLPQVDPADVVINLTGEINPKDGDFDAPNIATARRLRDHYAGGARHAIFISFPGAMIGSSNKYLKAKAVAEALTLETAGIATILRTTFICGTPTAPQENDIRMQTPKGQPGRCFGDGNSRYKPLLMESVVRILLACVAQPRPGAFALEGPDVLTTDQIIRLLNQEPGKSIRHFPNWLSRRLGPMIGVGRDFVEIFLADQLSTDPNIFSAYGLKPDSVPMAWGQASKAHA